MQDRDVLAAGQILHDRFRIVRTLGRGGMGAVYLAEWMEHRVPVAVKELRAEGPEGRFPSGAVNQFRTEAKILAGLDHPSLPRVYAFLEPTDAGDGQYYLVMEYVEGQTLDDVLLTAGGLEEQQVLDWARQLCEVLEYLHGRRPPVIFRDLKPSNVMVTDDGHIVLIDFGIAKFYDFAAGIGTHTSARGLLSPGYAAPEQYGGGTDVRSDIYSLGATLYCLLTREIPPDAVDIATGRVPPIDLRAIRPDISARTARAIQSMMAVERSRRPANMQAVMRALGFLGDEPEPGFDRPTGAYVRDDLPQHHPQMRGSQQATPSPPKRLQEMRPAARPTGPSADEAAARRPQPREVPLDPPTTPRATSLAPARRPPQVREIALDQPTGAVHDLTPARRDAALARNLRREAPAREKPSQAPLLAALAAVLVAIVAGGWWLMSRTPAAAPTSGGGAVNTSLTLTSDPAGARVYLDDQEMGVTPEMLSGIPAGRHDIRVERADWTPARQTVQVRAGENQTVHIIMQPRTTQPGASPAAPTLAPTPQPSPTVAARPTPSPTRVATVPSPRPTAKKTIDVTAPVVKRTTDVPPPTPTPTPVPTPPDDVRVGPPVRPLPPPLAPVASSDLIVPGKSVGDLVLGMPDQAARSGSVIDSQFEGQPLVVLRASGLAYVPREGHVGRILLAPFNPETVMRMTRFQTAGHVRLGARIQTVVSEFGEPPKVDDLGDHAELIYPGKGIKFVVGQGIVRVIEVMPP